MALILSRRAGETIHIGSSITITICQLKKSQVSLAIEAPKDVTILREEVKRRNETKRKENH